MIATDATRTDPASDDSAPNDTVSNDPPLDHSRPRTNRRLAISDYTVCAIGKGGSARCWGGGRSGASQSGAIQQITGSEHSGGGGMGFLHVEGWAEGATASLARPIRSIDAAGDSLCTLDIDGIARCWEGEVPLVLDVPREPLSQMSAGRLGNACGVKQVGGVVCWGYAGLDGSLLTPDRDDYVAVYVGSFPCGLDAEGKVGCWSRLPSDLQLLDEPGYVQIDSSGDLLCALHSSGTAPCIGGDALSWVYDEYATPYPDGATFDEISVGAGFACGVTTDQKILCWGSLDDELAIPSDFVVATHEELDALVTAADDQRAVMGPQKTEPGTADATLTPIAGSILGDAAMPDCSAAISTTLVGAIAGNDITENTADNGGVLSTHWFRMSDNEQPVELTFSGDAASGMPLVIEAGKLVRGDYVYCFDEGDAALTTGADGSRVFQFRITSVADGRDCSAPRLEATIRGCKNLGVGE